MCQFTELVNAIVGNIESQHHVIRSKFNSSAWNFPTVIWFVARNARVVEVSGGVTVAEKMLPHRIPNNGRETRAYRR